MRKTSYKIVAGILALSLSVVSAANAVAEDGYGYGAAGTQVQQPANDSGYVVPPAYNGEYYPQEYQGTVAYYGTQTTTDNRSTTAAADDQYYYYYY